MKNIYEAILKERIECYVQQLEIEISENDKLLKRYENSENKTVEILEYFKERLSKIKEDFETAKKLLETL